MPSGHLPTGHMAASSVTALLLVPLGEDGTVRDVPAYLMRRSRPSYPVEALTGTAVGPDGLYVAHMVYDAEEFFKPSSILRITPGSFERGGITLSGQDLLRASGCLGCHSHRGEGNSLSPDLDQVAARIAGRLADADYLATLRRLDRHSDPEISRLAEMRQRVLAASGEERIALWIRAKVAFPRFDDPAAEMAHIPNLSEQDIEAIAVFLARSGARGGRL